MACKHLNNDLSTIVRCSFTDQKVCKQWVEKTNLMETDDPYCFCEKQNKLFEPISIEEENNV